MRITLACKQMPAAADARLCAITKEADDRRARLRNLGLTEEQVSAYVCGFYEGANWQRRQAGPEPCGVTDSDGSLDSVLPCAAAGSMKA